MRLRPRDVGHAPEDQGPTAEAARVIEFSGEIWLVLRFHWLVSR